MTVPQKNKYLTVYHTEKYSIFCLNFLLALKKKKKIKGTETHQCPASPPRCGQGALLRVAGWHWQQQGPCALSHAHTLAQPSPDHCESARNTIHSDKWILDNKDS